MDEKILRAKQQLYIKTKPELGNGSTVRLVNKGEIFGVTGAYFKDLNKDSVEVIPVQKKKNKKED